MLHDGYGGRIGGKPGFIVSDTGQATRDEAYRRSVVELSNAWRGDAAPRAEAVPRRAANAARTDLATLNERLNDARRSAYQAYVDELTSAWRGP
jgi:hypothetical protein